MKINASPEAVATFIVGVFGAATPFLEALGHYLTTHTSITFEPNYINNRLVPLTTMLVTYMAVKRAGGSADAPSVDTSAIGFHSPSPTDQ